jgi:hypothetical protein
MNYAIDLQKVLKLLFLPDHFIGKLYTCVQVSTIMLKIASIKK